MCFYDQKIWSCGFWKWGTFRQQCHKEHRIGYTCGLKLVYEAVSENSVCILCKAIARKRRRLSKMAADIDRWQHEERYPVTIERTRQMMMCLEIEISALLGKHELCGWF